MPGPTTSSDSRPYPSRRKALRLVLALTTLAGGLFVASPAQATTITPTTNLDGIIDDGLCSLREAILAANSDRAIDTCPAGSGADTIVLPAGEYPLTVPGRFDQAGITGDLDVYADLTLTGAGQAITIVDAAGLDRILDIYLGATVTISGITLENGDADAEDGGGIRVDNGQLVLTDSQIRNNNGAAGGGLRVDNFGAATVINSRLSANTAQTGGALYTGDYLGSATAVLINSLVDGNSASGSAGGSSGGGLRSASGGDLTLINTTVTGNSATIHGGGIYTDNVVRLYNVTVTANTADSDGDDFGNGGGVTISNGSPVGTLTARNSLIAVNVDASPTGAQHANCSGTLTGEGYNLLGSATGCTLSGVISGNLIGLAPFLGPLQDNGGPTPTHALLSLSNAIDAGDPAGCLDPIAQTLTTDQRGYIRPVDGDGDRNVRCDIGAFEYGSPGAPAATATASSTSTPTATRTATPPGSATPTRTATLAATASPTATPTQTATFAATASPTRTATLAATASPTRTQTPAVSATATGSITPGPSPTATRTPTRTGTAAPGASSTPTQATAPTTPPPLASPTPSASAMAPTLTPVGLTPTNDAPSAPTSCSGFCLALPELHRP